MTRAAPETIDWAPDTITVPGPPILVDVPEDPVVRVAFTRRNDAEGDGNVSLVVGGGDPVAARRSAIAAVGADADRAVFMQQVHGGDVAVVSDGDAGRGLSSYAESIADVDGLVTTALDLPLVVLVADCVPVVLVAPDQGIAAVHAGRGGVAAGVVPAALRELAGDDPSDVVALIGPAIGGCCYEVPEAMADDLAARWPQARATTTWGAPSLDLPAAVTTQLNTAGVARVQHMPACTRCNADGLFSHRAAGAGAAPHGRQAGIVVRTGAPAGGAGTPSLQSP